MTESMSFSLTTNTSIGSPEEVLPVYESADFGPELKLVEPIKEHRLRKWLGRLTLGGLSLATVGSVAEINIPQMPYNAQADLYFHLGVSDFNIAMHRAPWEHPDPVLASGQGVQPELLNGLKSNFEADNNLFLSSSNIPFQDYAPTWSSAVALGAENILAYIPGPAQNEAEQSYREGLGAVNGNNWGMACNGLPGYDAKIAAFNSPSQLVFTDDNGWLAILDMQLPSDVSIAKQVFNLDLSQLDYKQGGIYWKAECGNSARGSRNVVSNAPFVMLAAELTKKTGNPYYLDQGIKVYNWINSTLLDKANLMYFDHINHDGSIDHTIRSYVQGAEAGATAATGHLDEAVAEIDRDLVYFKEHHTYQNPAFDMIFFSNAFWIAGQYKNQAFIDRIKVSLRDALKDEPNNPTNVRFYAGEVGMLGLEAMPSSQYQNLYFGSLPKKQRHNVVYSLSKSYADR